MAKVLIVRSKFIKIEERYETSEGSQDKEHRNATVSKRLTIEAKRKR